MNRKNGIQPNPFLLYFYRLTVDIKNDVGWWIESLTPGLGNKQRFVMWFIGSLSSFKVAVNRVTSNIRTRKDLVVSMSVYRRQILDKNLLLC